MYVATVKISRNGNSNMMVLPRPLCHYLKWNRGDLLKLTLEEDNSVTIRCVVKRVSPRHVLEDMRDEDLIPLAIGEPGK